MKTTFIAQSTVKTGYVEHLYILSPDEDETSEAIEKFKSDIPAYKEGWKFKFVPAKIIVQKPYTDESTTS